MAAYDPKRTRPTRDDGDDAPAQVDALLQPPAPDDTDDTEPTVDLRAPEPVLDRPAVTDRPTSADRPTSPTESAVKTERPVPPVLAAPAPDRTTQRVAVVAGVAAATLAAVMLWRRSRRRR